MLSAHSPAKAEPALWKELGGWDISFYPDREGCLAYTVFEGDTVFFIGFDFSLDTPSLLVTLIDNTWSSLETGKEYAIKVYFGDETPWSMDMEGFDLDGTMGLSNFQDAFGEQAEVFVEEFQRETKMRWTYRDKNLGVYTLRGSRAAFQEVLACQSSFLDALEDADPFAASDPFAD